MKFKYYLWFFFLMAFSNKVNAMKGDSWSSFERPPSRQNMSIVNIFEVGYIGISSIYAGYKTIRILFVDKNFNDNKLYLITNITKIPWALMLFGFFSNNKELCIIGWMCTLVSSILSIINLIIQEEFKKSLTSSILGCLIYVIDLFLIWIVYTQIPHI